MIEMGIPARSASEESEPSLALRASVPHGGTSIMKRAALALLLLVIPTVQAQNKAPADHSDLAKLIHNLVIPLVPKDFEDKSDWGKTAPLPPNLRLPRARRTVVLVEGRLEAPEGAW